MRAQLQRRASSGSRRHPARDPPAPATAGPRRGWKATARAGPDAHLLRAQHVFTEVTVCPAQPRDKPTHHRGEKYAGGGSRGATKSRPRRQASYDPSGGLARKAVLLRGPRARSGTRGSGARGFPQQRRPSEDRAGPRRGVSAVRPVGTLDASLGRSKSNSPRAKQHLQSLHSVCPRTKPGLCSGKTRPL